MHRLVTILCVVLLPFISGFSQSNEWRTAYTTFDDALNGTGDRTSSVAAIGPNRFVALVAQAGSGLSFPDNLLAPVVNYLVGYWDADSAVGRVPAPINGQQTIPGYNVDGQFTDWESGLDKVTFDGAWQLAAGGPDNYIYVANNDDDHNILVFQLDAGGVTAAPYRMKTGGEIIYAIEVDDNGYVYVLDLVGTDAKTDEVKVYAPIGAPGTTWGDFGGGSDAPTATIDLPPGLYQGITASGDGSMVFVSATSQRSLWKYSGDPVNGYTRDTSFEYTMAPDDTISNGGFGTPSLLGLAFLNDPPQVFAAVDSFLHSGDSGGYPYGRIYTFAAADGAPLDTIDIAEWNFAVTGDYSTGSSNGRAGGFTSVMDVDVENSEPAVYTQTYYGWAVEKWVFDGTIVGIEQISDAIPTEFALKQNYPNPFNPQTTIEFAVDRPAPITLEVFNLAGQRVAMLVNETKAAGTYRVLFDGRNLPSGIYFYRLKAGQSMATRKMLLTK